MKCIALVIGCICVAGCGLELVDPCAGVSGTCLGVHVEGSGGASKVDVIAFHVTGGGINETKQTIPNSGAPADLPIAVALVLDALSSDAAVEIDAQGGLAESIVGSGHADMVLSPGQHAVAHITLASDRVLDDAAGARPADLSPADRPSDLSPACSSSSMLTGPLISTFENGSAVLDSPTGAWFAANDGSGIQVPASGQGIQPTMITPPRTSNSSYALHTTGANFTSWGGQILVHFFPNLVGGYPADASQYGGVTFWARGTTGSNDGLDVRFPTTASDPACNLCTTCYDDAHTIIKLYPTWTQYTIRWTDLTINGFGVPPVQFDPSRLVGIIFAAFPSWDFWIDDISFVQ